MSENEERDIPEYVVDEMNRLHITDEGIYMGENWPSQSEGV
jgi:hypothetical protein